MLKPNNNEDFTKYSFLYVGMYTLVINIYLFKCLYEKSLETYRIHLFEIV